MSDDELKALIERARNHKMTPQERFDQMVSFVSEGVDKEAVRARLIEQAAVPQEIIDQVITAHTAALIDGAGEIVGLLDALAADCENTDGWDEAAPTCRQAAATIAALEAELARVKEALQWSVDRAPGNADGGLAYVTLTWDQFNEMRDIALCRPRALGPAAIARAIAMDELIAGDAYPRDTVADSDGDDAA